MVALAFAFAILIIAVSVYFVWSFFYPLREEERQRYDSLLSSKDIISTGAGGDRETLTTKRPNTDLRPEPLRLILLSDNFRAV